MEQAYSKADGRPEKTSTTCIQSVHIWLQHELLAAVDEGEND